MFDSFNAMKEKVLEKVKNMTEELRPMDDHDRALQQLVERGTSEALIGRILLVTSSPALAPSDGAQSAPPLPSPRCRARVERQHAVCRLHQPERCVSHRVALPPAPQAGSLHISSINMRTRPKSRLLGIHTTIALNPLCTWPVRIQHHLQGPRGRHCCICTCVCI